MATKFATLNAHGGVQILTGRGWLLGVVVGTVGGSGEVLSIYDGVGASGLLFTLDATTGRSFECYQLPIQNGLYASLAGSGNAASILVWYQAGGGWG